MQPTTSSPDAAFIAVAGTPTSLAAMDLRLTQFDRERIHGHTLTRETVERLVAMLVTTPQDEWLAQYPAVSKARADILPAGALILLEAMEHLGKERVTVSTTGLRYGIAMRELERRGLGRHLRLSR